MRLSAPQTAIMAVADLYQRFGDALLPATDVGGAAKPLTSMLAQVLLKCSSNDKKFVIEEAQRAMQVRRLCCAVCFSPLPCCCRTARPPHQAASAALGGRPLLMPANGACPPTH